MIEECRATASSGHGWFDGWMGVVKGWREVAAKPQGWWWDLRAERLSDDPEDGACKTTN
jgi:hypothetical protein